jgi:hypothetical protein
MAASVQGTSHLEENVPCQDAHQCVVLKDMRGQEVLVAIASDGAGSAKFSDQGSKMVCQYFVHTAETFLAKGYSLADLSYSDLETMVRDVRQDLRLYAELNEANVHDYACTVLVAMVDGTRGIFAQIGDGAIVFARESQPNLYYLPIQPNRGDYVNTTYFATDGNAESSLRIEIIEAPITEVAIVTDGLEHLAVKFDTGEAFDPFFKSFFPTLRQTTENTPKLSDDLALFLNSPKVNERTNDDKTFILATKRNA